MEDVIIFSEKKHRKIQVKLTAFKNSSGSVKPLTTEDWSIFPTIYSFDLLRGEEQIVEFEVQASPTANLASLGLQLNIDGKVFHEGHKVINYEHIPKLNLFPKTNVQLVNTDLKIEGKNIGYITGAGDLIPQSLKQIGYNVSILDESQLTQVDLSKFDAIITGVRAYNVNERLKFHHDKLMNYVKGGGVFLIQYNTSSGLLTDHLGPYPIKLSRNRVTEEDSAVKLIIPGHEVLNYPNKITIKDFDGWIQERGLYFVGESDDRYQRILSMNDKSEPDLDGSLLVADYGKGRFVYTSLSFFRELPAGVPGAYRLFVNLLSNK